MTSASLDDARSALIEAQGWLRPASAEALTRALSELYLRTARRAEEKIDRQAIIKLYARELSAYPGDIALDGIRRYRGTFFPALDELRGPIEGDARMADRRLRIGALEGFVSSWGVTPPKPKNPPSEAQRAAVRAWLNEGKEPAPLSDADREALARVDAVHGERAKNVSRDTFPQEKRK